MGATKKQVNYTMYLMDRAGYSTEWMTARHKKLGALMNERSGRVEDWLESMTMPRISGIIRTLKSELNLEQDSSRKDYV